MITVGYHYLEDVAIADAAFEARADSAEELFKQAADATMNVMVDSLDDIRLQTTRQIRLEDDTIDMLLFQFLNEFVYYKDAEDLLLRVAEIEIKQNSNGYIVSAEARGESMDLARHKMKVDVKAVTLHLFRVEKTDSGWEATVVLDI